MRASIAIVTLLLIAVGSSAAVKGLGNGPYVIAFEELSPFYARCLPHEKRGSKGTTQIVCVRTAGDEVITTYSWYNRNGLVLGWSPKAGKVAVMRVRQDEGLPPEKQVEFSFYLGEQHLQSFTTADLVKLGAKMRWDVSAFESGFDVSSKRAEYRAEGCKQVRGTNDYYFLVRLDDTRTLSFDILTGKLCRIEEDGSKQRLVAVKSAATDVEQGAPGPHEVSAFQAAEEAERARSTPLPALPTGSSAPGTQGSCVG